MKAFFTFPQDKTFINFRSGKWLLVSILVYLVSVNAAAQEMKTKSKSEEGNVTFNIFPNPSAGKFNVVIKEVEETFHINVYNLIGEMVYHWESNGASPANVEINLSKQPKGVYLVELDTEHANIIRKVLIDYEKGS